MTVLRLLGALLLALAAVLAVQDLVVWMRSGDWQPTAAGELWYRLHAPSLNAAQAGVQRYIHPYLWDPIIVGVLLLPGWLVLGVPGLALLLLGWRRRDRRPAHRFR